MAPENDKEKRKRFLAEHGFSERVCEAFSDYPCIDLIGQNRIKEFVEAIKSFDQELTARVGREEYQNAVHYFSRVRPLDDKHLKGKGPYDRLALLYLIFGNYHNIILLDMEMWRELERRHEALRKKDQAYFLRIPHKEITIIDDRGDPKQLDYMQCQYLESSVVLGFAQLTWPHNRYQYLGAYEIFRIAAMKGFGPFLFEMVFSFAAKQHHPVIIDRGEVSPDARKVWERFDSRREIIAYPAALRKYPELVGFTHDEVDQIFGPGIYHSATFDKYGLPDATSEAHRKNILSKIHPGAREWQFHHTSYLENESGRHTNPVTGELASLDKAFYYDGKVKLYDDLISKGETIDTQYAKIRIMEVGLAFFNSFAPKRKTPESKAA
ncbi:hypothetical protein KY363_07105 [Candidatus Woesearchaeota archaeon]|nr:hypothetical protein [Candidatus Woesearchaeota archaeon]